MRCPSGVLCVSSLIVVCCSCSIYAGCTAGSCAGSVSYLAQCRWIGDFFPKFAVFALVWVLSVSGWGIFALVWGLSVSGWGIFALAIVFLGCACELPFRSVYLSSAWAFACGGWPCSFSLRTSSLVVPACFCGSFLMRRSCVFLLSSCSERGRRLLSLFLGFASVPIPAALAVFRCVSCRRFPFGGYASFLAPDACPAPEVELCLWGAVSFSAALVFSLVPCSSSGACSFAQVTLRGFCRFLATSAYPTAVLVT